MAKIDHTNRSFSQMLSRNRKSPVQTTLAVLIVLASLVVVPDSYGQAADVVDSIEKALNKGDVSKLLSHGSDRIAVAVFGEAREYSQAQAEFVLKDFFKTHQVRAFSFDESSTTERGMFVQGRLLHKSSDRALRVFVRLRMRQSKWELREIIIRR